MYELMKYYFFELSLTKFAKDCRKTGSFEQTSFQVPSNTILISRVTSSVEAVGDMMFDVLSEPSFCLVLTELKVSEVVGIDVVCAPVGLSVDVVVCGTIFPIVVIGIVDVTVIPFDIDDDVGIAVVIIIGVVVVSIGGVFVVTVVGIVLITVVVSSVADVSVVKGV